MGKFAPVFLAFILNSFGVNIFRENTPGCEPLISSLIFISSVFILLWDMRIYPYSLKKLPGYAHFFLEFLLVDFIMEHIMADFWFPLEASMAVFLPKVTEIEKDLLKQGGWETDGIFCFLSWEGTLVIFSYALSFFFLFSVFHATRIVDFRLLTLGVGVFFKDVYCRLKKFRKKWSKYFGNKKTKFSIGSKFRSKTSKSLASVTSSDLDNCENLDSDNELSEECLNSYYVPKKTYL